MYKTLRGSAGASPGFERAEGDGDCNRIADCGEGEIISIIINPIDNSIVVYCPLSSIHYPLFGSSQWEPFPFFGPTVHTCMCMSTAHAHI